MTPELLTVVSLVLRATSTGAAGARVVLDRHVDELRKSAPNTDSRACIVDDVDIAEIRATVDIVRLNGDAISIVESNDRLVEVFSEVGLEDGQGLAALGAGGAIVTDRGVGDSQLTPGEHAESVGCNASRVWDAKRRGDVVNERRAQNRRM